MLFAIKGKAVVGGRLLELGREQEVQAVRQALAEVPPDVLRRAEQELLSLKDRVFWEVTDRQVNFEWVPPERREGLRKFFALLHAPAPVKAH
jgi:hypothetical protein